MNKLIEIAKEITRLWHEHDEHALKTLKKSGYSSSDIFTVVKIMKEANNNMMEDEQRRPSRSNRWID